MLSGDHIKLGWWIVQRDLIEVGGVCFVDPVVPYQITNGIFVKTAEALEIVEKANLILLRQFNKAGIVGIPIFAAEHWTLLVLRKVGEEVQVRYYDSLKVPSDLSRSVADFILQFFRHTCEEHKFPENLPEKSNYRSWQINGVDCGVFVLHFWEGEVRRFVGEGWSLKFPMTSGKGPIWKVRNRLIQLVRQMQKIPAEREKAAAKAKAKSKAKAAPALPDPAVEAYDLEEELLQVKKITEANLKLADLKKMVAASKTKGSVPFYGCSRCRYNRRGCINY